MVEISWEWVAGFFEGEGCIFWQEGKKGTKQSTCGRATIGQKEKAPLQAIYAFLIEQGFSTPAFYLRPAWKGSDRSIDIWMLTIQRREDVIRFLKSIEPFLFQKKEKAGFVINRLSALIVERNDNLSKALEVRKTGASWRDVSRKTGIGRVALNNYARAAGIELKKEKRFNDENDWRQDRVDRGLCEKCGKSRGENGTLRKCRACANKYNEWRNEYRRVHGRKDRHRARQKLW